MARILKAHLDAVLAEFEGMNATAMAFGRLLGETLPPKVEHEKRPTKSVPPDNKRWLRLEEAGALISTPPATIRYWVNVGKLKRNKPGRHLLIDREELLALVSGKRRGRR